MPPNANLSTAPKGTRHRQKKQNPPATPTPPRKPLTDAELEGLDIKIKEQFGWKDGPRPFQMDAIKAQLKGLDVLVHAGTGSGKTGIAAGPHVHPTSKGKVTLMVSPLIALHDEQVETFQNEFHLTATAVNSSHGGCNTEVLKKIVAGEWQIVLISPEMLLSRRFVREVLQSQEFGRRILSVVVDEAHVVSHWGSAFRKKYGSLGTIRAHLPKKTPIVAVSATLPARIRDDVLTKLQFDRKNYINIDVGNDRPNVSIVIRGMQYPMNTYADLDFVVQLLVDDPSQIPKTFIYADSVAVGIEIIDHLIELLPDFLRASGIIRPYSAAFSKTYRTEVMAQFRRGDIRILVCTDAAGMGCDIPDIDVVVQWKMTTSVSSFVQRAGRAAREAGRSGLAVMLVEPAAYAVDLTAGEVSAKKKTRGKGKKDGGKDIEAAGQSGKNRTAKEKKAFAQARGANRGAAGGKHDAIFVREQPKIDPEAEDEGLIPLIQCGTCRRVLLSTIYRNKMAVPTAPCCDLCDPSLLDRTRPGKPQTTKRQATVKRGIPCELVRSALHQWRIKIKKRDFSSTLFNATVILSDTTLELLSSVGPIVSRENLAALLVQWKWFGKYGEELYLQLSSLDIPAMVPLPSKAKGKKRAGDVLEEVLPTSSSSIQVPARPRPRKRQKMVAEVNTPELSHEDASNSLTAGVVLGPVTIALDRLREM